MLKKPKFDPACLNYTIKDLTADPIKMYCVEDLTGLKFNANLVDYFQCWLHEGVPTVRVYTRYDDCPYILQMLEEGMIRGVEHIKHLLR